MVAIRLTPDVPVDLALAYTVGKPVKGNKLMFSTVDQRVLFVPEQAGKIIEGKLIALGIQRGERILICQERTYEGGNPEVKWNVYKARVPVGQQGDGTFIVPRQPGAGAVTPTPIAATPVKEQPQDTTDHNKPAAAQPAQVLFPWAQRLLSETNALVDVFAAAFHYAKVRYGDQVRAEDVRELLATAYASRQNGGCDAA